MRKWYRGFLVSTSLVLLTACGGGSSGTVEEGDLPGSTPPITYSWVTGDWSTCSGLCGADNGQQSRTVTCQASTGESVDDGMCSAPKPAAIQACTASLCNVAPTIDTTFVDIKLQENSGTTNYELNVSDSDGDQLTLSVESNDTSVITVTPNWTNPLAVGSYEGQTLDFNLTTVADAFGLVRITITVDDGEDIATTSFDVNVTEQITYNWVTGDWGTCSGLCGVDNGEQNRTVICQASKGESVDDGMCSAPKPAVTQACTASLCNVAPTIDTTFVDIKLQENSGTTNYELNVSDSDGDILTLGVESDATSVITVMPNWTNPLMFAEYNGQTLDFNLTTVADAFGLVRITITVDDGEDIATTSFDVNVTQVVRVAVKKTGQTNSYDASGAEVIDSSLKDDGFYQKGVDHNYTRANDIVTDHVTKLMWQDDANVTSVLKKWLTNANYSTCSSDNTSPACYDTGGDTAATYCSALTLGGYNDWRLPTAEELEGIVDYGTFNPAMDTVYFNNTTPGNYWSSTTYGGPTKHIAWYVYSRDGNSNYQIKSTISYVRCVRDGE